MKINKEYPYQTVSTTIQKIDGKKSDFYIEMKVNEVFYEIRNFKRKKIKKVRILKGIITEK